MQGSRRFARLTGAPPENEGIGALTTNPVVRERASRSGRGESSKGPKRSFVVSRETSSACRMSTDARRGSYGLPQQHENPEPSSIEKMGEHSFMEGGDELDFVSPP